MRRTRGVLSSLQRAEVSKWTSNEHYDIVQKAGQTCDGKLEIFFYWKMGIYWPNSHMANVTIKQTESIARCQFLQWVDALTRSIIHKLPTAYVSCEVMRTYIPCWAYIPPHEQWPRTELRFWLRGTLVVLSTLTIAWLALLIYASPWLIASAWSSHQTSPAY